MKAVRFVLSAVLAGIMAVPLNLVAQHHIREEFLRYSTPSTNEAVAFADYGELVDITYSSLSGSVTMTVARDGFRIGNFVLSAKNLPDTETRNIEISVGYDGGGRRAVGQFHYNRETGEFLRAADADAVGEILQEFSASRDGVLASAARRFFDAHANDISSISVSQPRDRFCRWRTAECIAALLAATAAWLAMLAACSVSPLVPPALLACAAATIAWTAAVIRIRVVCNEPPDW